MFSIKPSYHTEKLFAENSLATEMKKTQITVKLLSMLDLSKTSRYEFWLNYIKLIYDEKPKLCYMDTDSFIVHVKKDDIYKDIEEDVEKRFDTSNYEIDRPLPK